MTDTNSEQMDTDRKTDQPQELAAASGQHIRLLPFWTDNPKLWFVTSEIQFTIHKMTKDDAKFGQLLLALTPTACETVQDILENPPNTDKYNTLKQALIDRNSPSEEKRLEALLEKQDMGDRRPSDVLRQLRNLASPNITPGLIKSLWMRKLPEFIRIALVPQQETLTTDELARIADKLNEAVSTTRAINSMQQQKPHSRQQSDHSRIENRLARVEKLITTMTNRSRSRTRWRPQSRTRSRPRSASRQDICWYHQRHGDKAHKCTQPCQYIKQHTKTDTNQAAPNK